MGGHVPHEQGRTRPPASRRVVIVAAAVLGLTLAALVADTRRARTGELLIQSDEADVRVVVRRDDTVVVPPTETRSLTLRPGTYVVELEGRPRGLRVAPANVTIARGSRSVVRIVRDASGR